MLHTLRQVSEFIDWRYITLVGFFAHLCKLAPLIFSQVHLLPSYHLPCVNNYTVYMYTVCMEGAGGLWLKEGTGPQTDKHMPHQSPFTGQFF
jgi:hypothetical protein